MISLIVLPNNIFDSSFSNDELYEQIYKYLASQMEMDGYGSVKGLEPVGILNLSELKEEEKFYVPTTIVGADRGGLIRGIDVIIYAYLCYMAYEIDNSIVKLEINEIANKTKIKKTQIRQSINNLVREECISPDPSKSGYYSIVELANPSTILETEALMRKNKV